MFSHRYLGLGVVLVLAGPGLAQPDTRGQAHGTVREKLIGAWRLVSLEEAGQGGKSVKLPRTGILMYTGDGHVAVQLLAPEGAPAASAGPIQYEHGGYEAYFGTYTVDEKASTLTHHVEGALVHSLIGKDLTREYRVSGRQLILKSSRPDEHWTVVWERY